MKKLTALLAALLATACGTQKLDPAEIRQAMPDRNAVQISQPAPAGAAARLQSPVPLRLAAAPAVGEPSPLALTSYFFATSVNVGVAFTLLRLELVTFWPATSCTETACTWGPGSEQGDLNRYMLVVTRNGDGYDYVLSGQPKSNPSAAFTPIISGTAFPGPTRPQGHGTLTADFDRAWAELDHAPGETQRDFGSLAVEYDGRTAMHIGVTFHDARTDDPVPAGAAPYRSDVVYAFDASGAAGELQVGFRTKAPFAPGYQEQVGLRTRWTAAGPGRADVTYDASSDPVVHYDGSQCWTGAAGGWAMTYDRTAGVETGLESTCAFSPASYFDLGFPQ